jgi:hypothetical protein
MVVSNEGLLIEIFTMTGPRHEVLGRHPACPRFIMSIGAGLADCRRGD